jgi:hypothetical protein
MIVDNKTCIINRRQKNIKKKDKTVIQIMMVALLRNKNLSIMVVLLLYFLQLSSN